MSGRKVRIRFSLRERVWRQVRKADGDGCWIWTGPVRHGYGVITPYGSHAGNKRTVHRLTYEWAYGPIPDGLVIDHLCRNQLCVRPDHLQAVTNSTNIRRAKNGSGPKVVTGSVTSADPTGMQLELFGDAT